MTDPRETSPVDVLANMLNVGSHGATAFATLGKLSALTDWDELDLCRHLGCDLDRLAESEARRLDADLSFSASYLEWVLSLITDLHRPTPQLCREIVTGTYELFEGVDSGVVSRADRLERCRNAFASAAGPYPPADYLQLGEVAAACETAAGLLPGTRAGHEAEVLQRFLSPLAEGAPHVHPARLALLDQDRAGELLGGPGVRNAIISHLQGGCGACKKAHDEASGPSAADLAA